MLKAAFVAVLLQSSCLFVEATNSDAAPGFGFAPAGGWKRRDTTGSLPECHLNYTTDVWTGCADVLAQFNITLAYFRYANPEITSNCASFVPGNTYCIFRGQLLGLLIGARFELIFLNSFHFWHADKSIDERTVWCPAELDEHMCAQRVW